MKKNRKKFSDLPLSVRTAITFGIIGVAVGTTYGAVYGYAQNSDEVKGPNTVLASLSAQELARVKSTAIPRFNKPEVRVLDTSKSRQVAHINADGTEFSFLDQPSQKYNFSDFYRRYRQRFGDDFVVQIRYGSFSFFDEYVLAIRPQQFIEFAHWFMENISYGPDIITLDTFRIVRGVEQRGGAITLGNHSTRRKEYSEIKFFPDGFFGSLPMYSIAGGRGHASDSLTYSAFNDPVTKVELDNYLKTIPYASMSKNYKQKVTSNQAVETQFGASQNYFKNLLDPARLKDQTVYVFWSSEDDAETYDYVDLFTAGRPIKEAKQRKILIWDKEVDQATLDMLKAKYPTLLANATVESFEPVKIDTLWSFYLGASQFEPNKQLRVKFAPVKEATDTNTNSSETSANMSSEANSSAETNSSNNASNTNANNNQPQPLSKEFYTFRYDANYDYVLESLNSLQRVIENSTLSFLDFYDIANYYDREVYFYKTDDNVYQFFDSYVKAYDSYFKYKKDASLEMVPITKATFKNATVQKQANSNLFVLEANLNLHDNSELKALFTSNEVSKARKNSFISFKRALGYQGAIVPTVLRATPEDSGARDEDGNALTGINSRKFELFNETYANLIDQITEVYPWLLEKYEGPHVVKYLNDQGFYEYKVEDGEYRGFSEGSRIGIPVILNALVDNYEGISTDFLKYVGAHEYGHHYTLERSQAVDVPEDRVVIDAINSRGGLNESSYYSAEAVRNYFYARTGLDFQKVDPNYNVDANGDFINFIFRDKDDPNKHTVEDSEDIFGYHKNNNVFKTLKNERRRFLQTYEGLLNAAKLRNVNIGDLFLANSIDRHSATLNPGISGTKKVIERDGNNIKFKELVVKDGLLTLKDGSGRQLTQEDFDAQSGTIKVIESTTQMVDGKTYHVVTKVNLKDKNGLPAINVPLNQPLDEKSWAYVQEQVSQITSTFTNLFQTFLSDNGWNTLSSNLNIEPRFEYGTADDTTFEDSNEGLNEWKENLKNRSNPEETDISFNPLGIVSSTTNKKRTANRYLVLSGDKTTQNGYLINSFLSIYQRGGRNPYTAPAGFRLDGVNYPRAAEAQINTVLVHKQTTGGAEKLVKYTLPVFSNSVLSSIAHGGTYDDSVRNIISANKLRTLSGRTHHGLDYFYVAALNNDVLGYVDQNETTFVGAQPSTADRTLAVNILADNFYASNENGTLVNTVPKDFITALKPLYKTSKAVSYAKTDPRTRAEVTRQGIVLKFTNFTEMVDVLSLDYSKATPVVTDENGSKKVDYNWDVEYVKTKFDIAAFINAIKNTENTDLQDKLHQSLVEGTDAEQKVANYLMYLFRNSGLVLAMKDFNPATELVNNKAALSRRYGFSILDTDFRDAYYEVAEIRKEDMDYGVTPEKMQEMLSNYVKNAFKGASEAEINKYIANLDTFDLFDLLGNTVKMSNKGNSSLVLASFIYSTPNGGTPSSDVINANSERNYDIISDYFSNYVYTLPETLTRDYVQTTFVPKTEDFGNTPSFISGANQTNVGQDYILDLTVLNYINSTKIDHKTMQDAQALVHLTVVEKLLQNQLTEKSATFEANQKALYKELTDLRTQSKQTDLTPEQIQELNNKLEEVSKKIDELRKSYDAEVATLRDNLNKKYITQAKLQRNETSQRSSNYFGQVISSGQGYLMDRFEKEAIEMPLYNDDGTPVEIKPEFRRLKNFEGTEFVTNVPEAFFVSQLLNFGVGQRTLSGIYRLKKHDITALYGYMRASQAQKVKKLRFTNVKDSSDVSYVAVNFENTNNMFWLQKQGVESSKKKLSEYGYVSWMSDYTYTTKLRESRLLPDNKYYVEFVDENNNVVPDEYGENSVYKENATTLLGHRDLLTENGKLAVQSPVYIEAEVVNGKKTGKAVMVVRNQFNKD
ncbi:PDxFFG protein [Mycoplasma corogypsi]|uniref:PDxFFG protein n=1 Tax=Mycoplasma corogypsi TaxID=2106 RepID=UPI003872B434